MCRCLLQGYLLLSGKNLEGFVEKEQTELLGKQVILPNLSWNLCFDRLRIHKRKHLIRTWLKRSIGIEMVMRYIHGSNVLQLIDELCWLSHWSQQIFV